MSASVHVVRATRHDVDRAALLFDAYRVFYGRFTDVAAARAFLAERLERDESVVLLAMLGERAVGFAQLYRTFSSVSLGRVTVLNDLYVAPSARRSGVAHALIEAAGVVARAECSLRLALSTQHTNVAARALYRSLGFVEDEEYVHMTLAL